MISHSLTGPPTAARKQRRKNPLSHVLHLEITERGIGVITFDRPGSSANIFDEAALDELSRALYTVEKLEPKGVIFTSAKPGIFIAGADLNSLSEAKEEQLKQLIEKGQEVFQRIAALPMPTLAAIHGACLGGGLELALACDQRIATDDKSTRLGLPETLLGIIPAWGGSTRLPRLLGLPKALDLILSGKTLTGTHARKLGLVDVVVPKERLMEAATGAVFKKPTRKGFPSTNNALSRWVIRGIARRSLLAKTRGNYPAQEAAVEVVTRGSGGSIVRSLQREERAVAHLAKGLEAANLMRLFRLQERAKKFRFAPRLDTASLPVIERTAVIGAGVMGAGIAQWFSAKGLPVILRISTATASPPAWSRCGASLGRR